MKKLKYIKITSILALALVFFACEKDAPLEASDSIDSRRSGQIDSAEDCGLHQNSKKGSSDNQGVDTSNDKDVNITDPGNDDDYDNEDPNPGNTSNSQQ